MRKKQLVGLAIVAVLALSACGQVSEALLEEAVEQAAGEDIEFNAEGDGFTISGDDGEISMGTGDLPEGFDFDLPDGYEVVSGWRQTQEDTTYYYVQVTYPGSDYEDVVQAFEDRSWPSDVQTSQTTGSYSSSSWVSYEADQAVTVSQADDTTIVAVSLGLS